MKKITIGRWTLERKMRENAITTSDVSIEKDTSGSTTVVGLTLAGRLFLSLLIAGSL